MGFVTGGFVSFTEVTADHRGYNEWHLYDHMPEQFPLPGIAWGQRWVLPPSLREHAHAEPPLDRIHYVTLYLLSGDLEQTVREFKDLGKRLRDAGRFHRDRHAHLAGPVILSAAAAASRVLVSAEAVPYRPNTGVHVRIDDAGSVAVDELVQVAGVAGAWSFDGFDGLRLTCAWLDDDPHAAAARLPSRSGRFAATFQSVDPRGPWDWFDETATTRA